MVTKKEHSILDYYRPFNIPMHPPEGNEIISCIFKFFKAQSDKKCRGPRFSKA